MFLITFCFLSPHCLRLIVNKTVVLGDILETDEHLLMGLLSGISNCFGWSLACRGSRYIHSDYSLCSPDMPMGKRWVCWRFPHHLARVHINTSLYKRVLYQLRTPCYFVGTRPPARGQVCFCMALFVPGHTSSQHTTPQHLSRHCAALFKLKWLHRRTRLHRTCTFIYLQQPQIKWQGA